MNYGKISTVKKYENISVCLKIRMKNNYEVETPFMVFSDKLMHRTVSICTLWFLTFSSWSPIFYHFVLSFIAHKYPSNKIPFLELTIVSFSRETHLDLFYYHRNSMNNNTPNITTSLLFSKVQMSNVNLTFESVKFLTFLQTILFFLIQYHCPFSMLFSQLRSVCIPRIAIEAFNLEIFIPKIPFLSRWFQF